MSNSHYTDRHMLAAVDTETTGLDSHFHEIIQIAIVPLGRDYEPNGLRPFYTTIRPKYPERATKMAFLTNGLDLDDLCLYAPDPDRVADDLLEWVESLELPVGGLLTPLGQNWGFDRNFIESWLGRDLMDRVFHYHSRDTMAVVNFLNDSMKARGLDPRFKKASLEYTCRQLGVPLEQAHDALADALATAEVYKRLVWTEWV